MSAPLAASPEWSKSRVAVPRGAKPDIKCYSEAPAFLCAVMRTLNMQYDADKIIKVSVEVMSDTERSTKTVAWVGADYLEEGENQSR